jgi:hypothetical protein
MKYITLILVVKEDPMTLWHKRALTMTVVWIVVSAGFLAVSLTGQGPAGLTKDTAKREVAAVFVGAGILANLVVRYLTRRRKDAAVAQVDERDELIHRKSSEIALGLTAAGVFIFCIVLNDAFGEAGAVPVDWLWFVAWSTMAASHLGQALTAVILYTGVFGRAQG